VNRRVALFTITPMTLTCVVCLIVGLFGSHTGLATTPMAAIDLTVAPSIRHEAGDIAVRAGMVHTMAGPPIGDGVVIVRDGRIVAVGPAATTSIPEGMSVREAAVVTPGLIDARSTVGLTGITNTPHDQDQLERSQAIQPELRAIDAYNAHDPLVEWLRSFGVTTVHTGHAPGELVSGQTMIVRTIGNTVENALIRDVAAVVATLGPAGHRSEGSPGTRGKSMAMLRQELILAAEYRDGLALPAHDDGVDAEDVDAADDVDSAKPSGERARERGRDLRREALVRVLDNELPLLVTANKAQDIASALRLAKEFDIRLWLDGAAESYLLIDEIKAAGVPVIIHPTMVRAYGEHANLSFETAAKLVDAGILVAMQSGYEGYVPKVRVVLFEAAIAAANGLGMERALATITSDAARLLGIDDEVGTIEVGKQGDLALYDGDPFEYTTRCTGTIIGGQVVSEGR